MDVSLSKLQKMRRAGKPGMLQSVGSQSQTPLSNWTTKTGPLPYAVPPAHLYLYKHTEMPTCVYTHTHICGLFQEFSKKSRCSVGHTADCMECITGSTSLCAFHCMSPTEFLWEFHGVCQVCVCVCVYLYIHPFTCMFVGCEHTQSSFWMRSLVGVQTSGLTCKAQY